VSVERSASGVYASRPLSGHEANRALRPRRPCGSMDGRSGTPQQGCTGSDTFEAAALISGVALSPSVPVARVPASHPQTRTEVALRGKYRHERQRHQHGKNQSQVHSRFPTEAAAPQLRADERIGFHCPWHLWLAKATARGGLKLNHPTATKISHHRPAEPVRIPALAVTYLHRATVQRDQPPAPSLRAGRHLAPPAPARCILEHLSV
jgi:hypothetical protein